MEAPIIIKKKKVHGHGGHHGGSWKVAYADFVTAMMAFFMVMWIMGLSDETRAQIQGYFNDPAGFMKNPPRTKTIMAIPGAPSKGAGEGGAGKTFRKEKEQAKELQEELKHALETTPDLKKLGESVEIELTPEGLRIEFLEDKSDFFESGKAVLKPGAVKVINLLGPRLRESGRSMIIEGHTDAVPFAGDPLGNAQLSTSRAQALQRALFNSGIPAEQFLYVKGLADQELRDPEHPSSAVNRRVTILLPYSSPKTTEVKLPKEEIRDLIRGEVSKPLDAKAGKPRIAPEIPDLVHVKKK